MRQLLNKLVITPFLIVNPLLIVWGIGLVVDVSSRDGMAVMVAPWILYFVGGSAAGLLVDRWIATKRTAKALWISETLLLCLLGLVLFA